MTKNQKIGLAVLGAVALYFILRKKTPSISEQDKINLFSSTIIPQRGIPTPESLRQAELESSNKAKEKIIQLGLDSEYKIWIENYKKIRENAPNVS